MRLGLLSDGMDLPTIAEHCEGILYRGYANDKKATGVSTDSRSTEPCDIFFAIKGENFDGHEFISAARDAGALCAVTSRKPDVNIPYILVDDVRRALGAFAAKYKSLIAAKTVAVTGSVGKTTTRQYVYSVLSTRYKTQKTDGNYNNDIGLPLTLFSVSPDCEALVLEMGMSALGEISALSRIARPDVAVITNIGNSHIEHLGSRENILKAKLEILDGMHGGTILLNGDDTLLRATGDFPGIKKYYFGIEDPLCDFRATSIIQEKTGLTFDVLCPDGTQMCDLHIQGYGKHNVYDALAGIACGYTMGVSPDEIRKGLTDFQPVAMRQNIQKKGKLTVIEDCYNASPESMAAAIETLCGIARGRKVAVLGDMRELGKYSPRLHYILGEKISVSGVDTLVTIGKEAEKIARGAKNGGMAEDRIMTIESADDPEAVAEKVKGVLRDGDTVLIKASRALALERISKLL